MIELATPREHEAKHVPARLIPLFPFPLIREVADDVREVLPFPGPIQSHQLNNI